MSQGAADLEPHGGEPLPATRDRILDAALEAFVAHGFEAASTRDIARRAGVQQPLINYHFGSKEKLWKAALDYFFDESAEVLDARIRSYIEPRAHPGTRLRRLIRDLIEFSAHHPQLARFLLREGREPERGDESRDRLKWLVSRHFRPHIDALEPLLVDARDAGLLPKTSPISLFYMLAGLTSTIYLHGEECRLLSGEDPTTPDRVDDYADAVAELVLGSFETAQRSLRNQKHSGLGSNLLRPSPAPG